MKQFDRERAVLLLEQVMFMVGTTLVSLSMLRVKLLKAERKTHPNVFETVRYMYVIIVFPKIK